MARHKKQTGQSGSVRGEFLITMHHWLFPVEGKKPRIAWGDYVDAPYGGVEEPTGGLPLGDRWVCLDFESLNALVRFCSFFYQQSPLLQGLWVRSPKGMHIYFPRTAHDPYEPAQLHELELRTGRQYMVFPKEDTPDRYLVWCPHKWEPMPKEWEQAFQKYAAGEIPNKEAAETLIRTIRHVLPDIETHVDLDQILAPYPTAPKKPLKSPVTPVKDEGAVMTLEMRETRLRGENSGQKTRFFTRAQRANRLLALDHLVLETELFKRVEVRNGYWACYRQGGTLYQGSYLAGVNLLYQYSTKHPVLKVRRYTAQQLLYVVQPHHHSLHLQAETYAPRIAVRVLYTLMREMQRTKRSLSVQEAQVLIRRQLGYRLTPRQVKYRLQQLVEWRYVQKEKTRYRWVHEKLIDLPNPDFIPVVFTRGYLVDGDNYWRTEQFIVLLQKHRIVKMTRTKLKSERIDNPWKAYLEYLKNPSHNHHEFLKLTILNTYLAFQKTKETTPIAMKQTKTEKTSFNYDLPSINNEQVNTYNEDLNNHGDLNTHRDLNSNRDLNTHINSIEATDHTLKTTQNTPHILLDTSLSPRSGHDTSFDGSTDGSADGFGDGGAGPPSGEVVEAGDNGSSEAIETGDGASSELVYNPFDDCMVDVSWKKNRDASDKCDWIEEDGLVGGTLAEWNKRYGEEQMMDAEAFQQYLRDTWFVHDDEDYDEDEEEEYDDDEEEYDEDDDGDDDDVFIW